MDKRTATRSVYLLQILFLLVACIGLNEPFLGAHFERQNQTFDIARHIFREGWSAVLVPKASFSLPGYLFEPFTVSHLDAPFHGLLGWPIAALIGHDFAVVRLISTAFAMLSIQLLYLTLSQWLRPLHAVVGAFIWATAPLLLHFGQVPMPDILAVAGIAAAFYFALQSNLVGSGLCFLFAVLAKETLVPFGLPVLAALIVSRQARKPSRILMLSAAWAIAPLAGLAGWIALGRIGPPTPWTLFGVASDPRFGFLTLLDPSFLTKAGGCLLPFGVGVLGAAGLALLLIHRHQTSRDRPPRMDRWILGSIVFANAFYFVFILRKVAEPQYFLPILFWLAMAAAFGFARIEAPNKAAIAVLLAAHLALACAMTVSLKRSRVPDFPSIAAAAKLLPPGARVAVFYRSYGGGPAVWLDRNVLALHDSHDLEHQLKDLKAQGFAYAMILDVDSFYTSRDTENYIQASSPYRQYCDRQLTTLYARPHMILYGM